MFPHHHAESSPRDTDASVSIVVDAGSRCVTIGGVPLHLTPIEYRLLEHLVREAGRVVSRDELLSAARQREAGVRDRALDVHVSHLRAKLHQQRGVIRTVRGEGYVFASSGAEAPPLPVQYAPVPA